MAENDPIGNADWLEKFRVYESLPDGKMQIMQDRYPDCDKDGCSAESVYYYRHQCCGAVSMGCELHTHAMMRFLINLHNDGTVATCMFCKKNKIPLSLITRPQPLRLHQA